MLTFFSLTRSQTDNVMTVSANIEQSVLLNMHSEAQCPIPQNTGLCLFSFLTVIR